MAKRYAEKTAVSSEKSRQEIERTLSRYAATGFVYGWQQDRAVIGFEMKNRRIRFVLPMPAKTSREFTHDRAGKNRPISSQAAAWEQACRQRWRALSLAVKAKLEAVESGIATFEEEFLAHIVLPNGKTMGEAVIPQIESSYKANKMPPLLGHS